MSLTTGARIDVASRTEERGPARKGYGIAYDLLGNRAEAEEAVQEALARACESIADLRDPVAAPAWFLRIVTTMCLRTLRRRKLKRALLGWLPGKDDTEVQPDASTDAIAERMHGPVGPVPVDALTDREAFGALMTRLDQLSAQQRTALVLRYGHDLGVPEIAQLLGVGEATAKTHLVRGLARLRDLMEEHR
jgi:RNA polymerase sigma-70 factor (ECF subfamily)